MKITEPQVEISPSGLMDVKNAAIYLGVFLSTMRTLWRFHRVKGKRVGKAIWFAPERDRSRQ